MKLCAHPDFEQAIVRAAEHFRARGLRPALIEKDYYVTEALRILAHAACDKVILKGGRSLSKGWNVIRRFSEDILRGVNYCCRSADPIVAAHEVVKGLKPNRTDNLSAMLEPLSIRTAPPLSDLPSSQFVRLCSVVCLV